MKITTIFGTRPEAIKLAPVVLALRRTPGVNCRVCVTGQHREMLDQVLQVFSIVPDTDLRLMEPNQTLGRLTGRAIEAIDRHLAAERPDLVLVQGDTTTVFCAALAAFYQRIPVGHVEAGLRTGNLEAPWPEEANRVLTSRLARLHFAPTAESRANLLREGVPDRDIHVTGNTVIDALLLTLEQVRRQPPVIAELPPQLQPGTGETGPRMVLITGHRRENFGGGFESICQAIAASARAFPDVHFVYPVHLNPNVREPVGRILGSGAGTPLANVHLIAPAVLPAIRGPDGALRPDPHRLGRRAGGGPQPRKTGAGDAGDHGATRGRGGRDGASGGHGSRRHRRRHPGAAHRPAGVRGDGPGPQSLRRRPGHAAHPGGPRHPAPPLKLTHRPDT